VITIIALIVVDMQEDYIGSSRGKKTHLYNADLLISNINAKIEQYHKNGDMIIYIQNVAKGKKSSFVNELHIASELVYEKNKASCFTNHELNTFLIENNIKKVELVGIDGNYCVGMSALEGVNLGFTVKLILECIGVAKTEKFIKMKERLLNAGVIIN